MLAHNHSVLMGPAGLPVGGGGGFPPSPEQVAAPGGIPDPRNAIGGAPDLGGTAGITELINSGLLSAEELIQLVAALAGLGEGVPGAGAVPGGGTVEQAFGGGGGIPGGIPGGGGAPQLPGLPL